MLSRTKDPRTVYPETCHWLTRTPKNPGCSLRLHCLGANHDYSPCRARRAPMPRGNKQADSLLHPPPSHEDALIINFDISRETVLAVITLTRGQKSIDVATCPRAADKPETVGRPRLAACHVWRLQFTCSGPIFELLKSTIVQIFSLSGRRTKLPSTSRSTRRELQASSTSQECLRDMPETEVEMRWGKSCLWKMYPIRARMCVH